MAVLASPARGRGDGHVAAGITAERMPTSRLTVAVLSVADRTGPAVLFVHGNVSSSLFWQPTMLAVPEPYRPERFLTELIGHLSAA